MREKTNLLKIRRWIIFLILMLLNFFAYEQSISNDFIVLDRSLEGHINLLSSLVFLLNKTCLSLIVL